MYYQMINDWSHYQSMPMIAWVKICELNSLNPIDDDILTKWKTI